ncbi:MAG: hypothetical protein KatS3mg090_0193 [Patescibacteria group bacterium]|nr:MAG: hypothetical protein KatS3mg090_0193 [Patescibacteria group bacterium]
MQFIKIVRKYLLNFKTLLVLVVLIIAVLGYFFLKNNYLKQDFETLSRYTVVRKTLQEEKVFSGNVSAERVSLARFAFSGTIASIAVSEGDKVVKGQVLASLDRQELEKDLKKYLNYYLKTRWDFDQKKEDYQDFEVWGIPEKEKNEIKRIVEKAQFDLDNSVLDVEIKNLALQKSVLKSPIDGIVTRIDQPIAGVYVTPTQAEFEIVDENSLIFEVLVEQDQVVDLALNETGTVILDSFPDKEIPAEVFYISFSPVDTSTGVLYKVKARFLKQDLLPYLRLGMTGELKIFGKRADSVLVVPVSFIETEKDKDYVYLLANSKPTKVAVQTGLEVEGEVEIKSGLKEGDILVLPSLK